MSGTSDARQCPAVDEGGYQCELEPDHASDIHRAIIGEFDEQGPIPERCWREIAVSPEAAARDQQWRDVVASVRDDLLRVGGSLRAGTATRSAIGRACTRLRDLLAVSPTQEPE